MLAGFGPDREDAIRKAAALAAAIAVQAALLAMLTTRTPHRVAPKEKIVYLPIAPMRRHREPKPAPVAPVEMPRPRPHIPTVMPKAVAPETAAPDTTALQGLHALLFDCGPDQILTDEERKRCESVTGAPKPDVAAGVRIGPERSKDAARWARELARKQAPLLLPCASPYAAGVSIYTLYCLGKGAIEGFDLDALPGYGDVKHTRHGPRPGDTPPTLKTVDH